MARGNKLDDYIGIMTDIKAALYPHSQTDHIASVRCTAIQKRKNERNLNTPTTLIDALTRRLGRSQGGISMDTFDYLVFKWWSCGDKQLEDMMLREALHDPYRYSLIQNVFARNRIL